MAGLLFRAEIPPLHTLVVKVGSRILTAGDEKAFVARLDGLVEDIVALRREGVRTLLVSSGAIAHGMRALKLSARPSTIPHKQAAAAIGQIRLMQAWETRFAARGIPIGQVLLTADDLRHKERYLNLRNTLFALLQIGAVPVINENDSVGVAEIRFGDNDTLGAHIALLAHADAYVNLTDINGLYDADPSRHKQARHIPLVTRLTAALHGLARETGSAVSVGGMKTKLKAAEMVTRGGIAAIVGDGFNRTLLEVLRDASAATVFLPTQKRLHARQCFIAFAQKTAGALGIDDGAAAALMARGKSLLPAGIRSVQGDFSAGDSVDIVDVKGRVLGRGLVNFSALEARKIAGLKSNEIAKVLGEKTFDEVVHRDNLVVF
ncbi:MAG: glutamate 5-kinase [Chitinivibrionales bacterium]|nr:glutamate 5-kinase [Chitinivibrionales bacterium]